MPESVVAWRVTLNLLHRKVHVLCKSYPYYYYYYKIETSNALQLYHHRRKRRTTVTIPRFTRVCVCVCPCDFSGDHRQRGRHPCARHERASWQPTEHRPQCREPVQERPQDVGVQGRGTRRHEMMLVQPERAALELRIPILRLGVGDYRPRPNPITKAGG